VAVAKILIEQLASAVTPAESAAVSPTVETAADAGVPVTTPEAVEVRPAGRPAADQLYGGNPRAAVNWNDIGDPTEPVGSGQAVMVGMPPLPVTVIVNGTGAETASRVSVTCTVNV